MTAEEMWERSGLKGEYGAWSFGGSPDELARLVLVGRKRATSSLYCLYGIEDEKLPEPGDYSVILDSSDEAVCVIRTDSVEIVPFGKVSDEFASSEGEGDLSLGYWKKVHKDFFENELGPYGLALGPETEIVCERFTKIYPQSSGVLSYIALREKPELADRAAGWFHDKWGVDKSEYAVRMSAYLSGETELGWYLCTDGDVIAGGLGVIENDFHNRPDLAPNICAVYTEPAYRGRGIAGRLLDKAVADLREQGISPVYLLTDHEGFYERYGWEFLCMVQGNGEDEPSRMYMHR